MTTPTGIFYDFEKQVTAALKLSAQLAREEAIRYGTSLIVYRNNQLVEIPPEELKKQLAESAETGLAKK